MTLAILQSRSKKTSDLPKSNSQQRADYKNEDFLTISNIENDARDVLGKSLFRPDFKVKIDHITEKYNDWDECRINSVISWSESRGLAKREGEYLVGNNPSIECFQSIIFKHIVKNTRIDLACHLGHADSLLLDREVFKGKVFNDKGNIDIQLTASADRSGKIKIEVSPVDYIKQEQYIWLADSKHKVNLDCESNKNKIKNWKVKIYDLNAIV